MKRVVIGILISLVMVGSVLANATVVNNGVEFEDGKITISIEIGDFHIKVIPTYSPKYLLHNPNKKDLAWLDVQLIQKEYDQVIS